MDVIRKLEISGQSCPFLGFLDDLNIFHLEVKLIIFFDFLRGSLHKKIKKRNISIGLLDDWRDVADITSSMNGEKTTFTFKEPFSRPTLNEVVNLDFPIL